MSLIMKDFRCEDCNFPFEKLVKPGFTPKCEDCGSKRVINMLNYAGYQIKGRNSSSTRPRHSAAFKKAVK